MDVCQAFPLYKQFSCGRTTEFAFPRVEDLNYLHIVVCFTLVIYVFELYLDIRQMRKFYNHQGLPKELKEHVTTETFEKSVSYRKDKFKLKIAEGAFTLLLSLGFLYAGYLPYIWDRAAELAVYLGAVHPETNSAFYQEFVVTYLFLGLQTLFDTVLSLPFGLYSTFGVEAKHGFNKSTVALFFSDKLTSLALMAVISLPILPALIYLVRAGGDYFVAYVWVFLFVVSLIMMTVYPVLIAPLFNKFTPLEEGDIKKSIDALAKQVNFFLEASPSCDLIYLYM